MSDPPAAFGRYRLVGPIGAGAIGTVYRALDPLIGRPVAIKIIRTELLAEAETADYLERFRTEAQAGGRCLHPAIVAIHDAGEQQGAPYLVMEYVEGRSLQAILADPAARAGLDPIAIMDDILAGLGYAHARDVTHRDIKPANIMITPEGRAKIADFGIARIDRGGVTQIGDLIGTPSYMAPEQVTGAGIDHRADLFSAAAVMHAMLLGRPPFAGKTVADTLVRLTSPAPVDLSALNNDAFAAFAPILARGLAKSPDARFASAAEFAAALRTVASPEERTVIMATPRARRTIDDHLIAVAIARLAPILGPIARIRVTAAAQQAAGEAEFLRLLADHITDPKAAYRFLQSFGAAAGDAPPTTVRTGIGIGTAASAAARGVSPAALAAAQAVLAPYTGPIARVLIAQALRDAPTLDGMVEQLVRAIPKPGDIETMRRKLRAALTLT